MKKTGWLAGLFICIVIGMCGPVSAQETGLANGTYKLINAAYPNLAATVQRGVYDDAAYLDLQEFSNKNSQIFRFTVQPDGRYTIQPCHSDKYLELEREADVTPEYTRVLRQYADLTEAGMWTLVPEGADEDGTMLYQIEALGDCTTAPFDMTPLEGHVLMLYNQASYEGAENRSNLWRLESCEPNPKEVTVKAERQHYVELEKGIYTFVFTEDEGIHWDMYQKEGETPVLIVRDQETSTNKFYIQKEQGSGEDALYSIRPLSNPGQVLERSYSSYVEQVDYVENKGAQLWHFVYGGFGRYLVQCVDNGNFVSYNPEEGIGAGAKVVPYDSVPEEQIRWYLEMTPKLSFGME